MLKLKIAEEFSLPIDAATQTLLIFGKRGSGKSTTATRFAEQLIAAAVPIAVLDPVDVWWGLKAGGEGKREGGRDVYVFGGAHQDLPLESTAGALMADTIVEHRINAVFVIREFSRREKAKFVADFAERLFQRNREAMHLFCEEAHEVMPLKTFAGEEEMLGRMTRLQKLGRTSGIGLTAITQRPASLHTDARTQAEILVVHRIIGPHDRDAIDDWIKYHHVQDARHTVMETLATLRTGEAWIWSPEFPEEKPIGLRRATMLLPETFDSRRTPKPGEKAKQPKALAAVDLEKLRAKMSATIEKAKADDPRELRKQIAELKKQLAVKTSAPAENLTGKIREKVVEKFVLKDGQLARAEQLLERIELLSDKFSGYEEDLRITAKEIRDAIAMTRHPHIDDELHDRVRMQPRTVPAVRPVARTVRTAPPRPLAESNGDLSGPERKILTALCELEAVGLHPADKLQLGLMAGYTNVRSGGFSEPLGRLVAGGYVASPQSGVIALTDTGRAAGDHVDAPSTTEELQARIMVKLTGPEQKLLTVLLQHYPDALTKEQLGELTGYSNIRSGGFSEPLGRLRTLGLVVAPERGVVGAASALFLEDR